MDSTYHVLQKFRRYKRYSRCQCLTVVNIFVTNIANLSSLSKAQILTFQDARAYKRVYHSKSGVKEEYSPPKYIFLFYIQQYLVRGAQFSEAGLNTLGPGEK